MKQGLANLDITNANFESRCVGGAFDGEYFHLKVPQFLLESALIAEDAIEWYSFTWDPAHIIELAEHDARKHKNCKDIQRKIDYISEISRIVSYGKNYREIKEISEETSRQIKAPRHFSNTRFATYSSEVIKTFINNYEAYYKLLNNKQKDELNNINNAPFLFTIAALDSVYRIIAKASNAIQKPDMPSWEVYETLDIYLSTLEDMANCLITTERIENVNKALFPTLFSIIAEVSENGEFSECPILDSKHNTHRTRNFESHADTTCLDYSHAFTTSAKEVARFIETFSKNARVRFATEDDKKPILKTCSNLFYLTKVKSYSDFSNVAEDLSNYVELAIKTGNLHIMKTQP